MRGQGVVDSARGLLPFGHLGWAYRNRAELRSRAREYLLDGIAAGQFVQYVGDGDPVDLRDELAGFAGVAAAVRAGTVGVCTVEEFYAFAEDGVVDPEASVAARMVATEQVLAAGFTGFRAIVDCTAVTSTPAQRAAFARFEYLIDQQMSVLPVSAICAFDLARMGVAAAAELVCLHPFTDPHTTPFRLYAEHGVDFALAGELDLSCHPVFEPTLERTLPAGPVTPLVIEARELTYVDHTSMRCLNRVLARRGVTATLRTTNHTTGRIAELIDFAQLRVELVA